MKFFTALLLCFCLLVTPVYGAENQKLVALTFDDGPSGRFTRTLLDGLHERNAKATFLLCGYRMAQYPALTQQIFQEGHEIGLHGYSHKSMRDMCAQQIVQETRQTMALLPEGCEVSFLRPPGGICGNCVQMVAEKFGLSVLNWSVDPRDWATDDAAAIENAVIRRVRDGDVILLHDMSESSVKAALNIVDQLKARGFRLVTASELARARNITPIPGTIYTCFRETDPKERK